MIHRRAETIAALLAGSALTAFAPAAALAQETPAEVAAEDTAADDIVDDQNVIIVTGTNRSRVALDTPLAVTTADSQDLQRLGVSSQADILNSIPTIKADAGGGEVAANVFIKGLPSGGQYQFTPLMYDGIPVLSTFGLNSSAYDVYYRNDLGIDRLEFVRGGVSNLFGPGSVAGLINYISTTGDEEFGGVAQLEVAEKDRYKGDVAVHGPLGENLFYALSGWYRSDKGPIRTNLDTEGFQVRGNLRWRFPDDSGHITLYGQYIDDEVVFYLPVPLNGATRNRAPGNDGRNVFSVHNEFDPTLLGFNTPDGPFLSEINDGVATRGGQVAVVFDKDFGDTGFGIDGKVKYSDYKHKFGLWLDGDGLINVPETLQSFLTNRGLGSTANAQFTFVGAGAVPPGSLLFANRFIDRDRPMHDLTAELNLTKELTTGNIEHSLTLGGFYGDATARDVNVVTTYLAEFNNRPQLVNVVVTNPTTGAQTVISRTGLLNAGAGYANNKHSAERYAGYLADQMQIGSRFNFDIGVRVEHYNGEISRERTSTTITDPTTPNLSAALRDVIWGNDGFLTGEVSTTEWAVAAGALYKLTDRVSLYANASRGYFFPEIRAVGFRPLAAGTAANASASPGTASYAGEIIKQGEVGIKISQPQFSMTVAGLYTKLTNRQQVLFVNDGMGGVREAVNLIATESYGVEATLDLRLLRYLNFSGNLTIQEAKYRQFQTLVNNVPTPNPAIIGNDLERQPNILYNAGLYYDDGALDASFFTNYTGDNFVASNNAVVLQGWNIVNFDAGYKIPIGANSMRVGINVFNVFDTDAVTEGSPRQDNNQTTGGQFFVGRPVLPRRITGRLTFNF
ncbi:MAG: TonB-dependent receptor [Novosphingobium sp.]|nr:TonB-dependent receptor [Novosphingobium sp.]